MGQSGESEQQRPRRSLKLRAKKGASLAYAQKLPLVLRGTYQGTDSHLFQPLERLLQHEDSQAQLATLGGNLPGTAVTESTNLTDLPSTPRATRKFEELIVPDSPEQTWSGKGSSRRPCRSPRTPPPSTNFDELVVPESPEEIWTTPLKFSQTPLTSTSFEELVVPESPEESKNPSNRPCKLRRTDLRKVLGELVDDGNADLERGCSESSPFRTAMHPGKLRFKNAADFRNTDCPHHCDGRLPVLGAEKTSSAISDQPPRIDCNEDLDRGTELRPVSREIRTPRVTDGVSTLLAFLPRRRTTASKKPLVVTVKATNKAHLPLEDSSRSRGADCHKGFLRNGPTLHGQGTEDPAPVTPLSTTSKMFGASSTALQKPGAFLGDGPVKEAKLQRNLHRDLRTPVSSSTAIPAPTTLFPLAGGKPLPASFGPLKMKALRGDELEGAEGSRPRNVSKVVPTSMMGNENAVPVSCFATQSGKSVSVASVALRKARAVMGAEVEGTEIVAEFAGTGYQGTVHTDGRTSYVLNTDNLQPMAAVSVAMGNTLSAYRDVQTRTTSAIDGAVPNVSLVSGTGKPFSVSSVALVEARAFTGDQWEGSETCNGSSSEEGNRGIGQQGLQTSNLSNTRDAAPMNSTSMGGGKTLSSSRDAQTPTLAAIGGAVPLTSFATGSGKPISVSSAVVKEVKALLGDESRSSESCAELREAGYQGNVLRDVQTSKFSSIKVPAPRNVSSMAMGKTLSHDYAPTFNVFGGAVPISSFVTGSGKPVSVSSVALKKARVLLGDELDDPESCAELLEAEYQGNANGNFQAFTFSSTEDVPPINSSIPGKKSLSTPTQVKSRVIDNPVPIASFVTGSGKPVTVSFEALGKARELFGGDFEDTATGAGFRGANDQRNLCKGVRNPAFQEAALTGNGQSASEMPKSVTIMPKNNGDGVVDAGVVVGATSTGFCTGSGKTISVSSLAMEKAKVRFRDYEEENDDSPTRTNPGPGNQTATLNDTISRKGGIPEPALSNLFKKAEILLVGRQDGSNSGRVPLGPLSTASGNHISGSSLAANEARRFLRDDDVENDLHRTLPRTADDLKRRRWTTNERGAVRNFGLPSLTRGNGARPFVKPGYTSSTGALPASVSTRGPEGKARLGDDEKENHLQFERASCLECHPALRNSGFATDRTRELRPLSEIQPGVPVSHSAGNGEKFCLASDKLGSSCSSHPVQRKENPEGSPFRNRSGRTITISSEAIQAAKARIAPCEGKKNASEPAEKTVDSAMKASFKTSSGRIVTISSGAIDIATTLLADGMETAFPREPTACLSANDANTVLPNPTPAFRTSSGRTVAISREAMSRAKALLAPYDRGLDITGSSPEEVNASRYGNVNGDGAASRGPCAAVTPCPSNRNREATSGEPTVITSRSPQLNMCNPDASHLSAKPASNTGGSYQRRNVRAFKPPRMRNQPNDVVSSKGESCANPCGNQPQSLNPFTSTHGHHSHQQLPSLRPSYLQDRESSSMSGRMKLRDYIGEIPASNSEVLPTSTDVRLMTADAAENYRIVHVTGDGRQESVGSTEIWRLLLGLGADIRYASKEWVSNHYKWIIWKLASSERNYPRKLVTLDTVLQELKYRYDRELSGRRSAIRRITEGDSSASRTMVLCASAVRYNGDNETVTERTGKISTSRTAKIEVTDGWYRLNAVLDAPFTDLLRRGKLKVGRKFMVCGATLCCGSDPKPPLEAFQDSFLALHMNGTRRVRRNQRLGFCRGPFLPLAFRCIKPGGGLVPKTYVGVTRVYPILFREISANGTSIVRSARAEELASNQFEQRRANAAEEAILKLESSCNPWISQEQKDELFEAVERAAEPDILMADMPPAQLKAFAVYQAKRVASKQAAIEDAVKESLQQAGLSSRDVKRLLKVRVTGLNRRGDRNGQLGKQTKEGTITIWDASDELDIAEGSVYCVSGLRPGTWGGKSASNEDQLYLQAYRSASWRHVPDAIYEKHFSFPYTRRAPTRLSDMDEKLVFREFDVAAMVLHVEEPFSCGSRTNQWVFVSDGSTAKNRPGDTWDEMQILAIRVTSSSPAFAPVDPSLAGSVVGCCNFVQQPKDYNSHYLVAEASELSFICSNLTSRPVKHLQAAANRVSEWVKSSRWEADSLRFLVQGLTFESGMG